MSLLQSIALCLKKKLVCRYYFFGKRDLSEEDIPHLCSSGKHKWFNPIVLIPSGH